MKKRNGFVSNSSSSSFICCYATIVDEEKAREYIKSVSGGGCEILTKEEALKKKSGWCGYGADWAGVWCEPKIEEDKDYKYLVYESYGGAGDGDHDFSIFDDDGDFCDFNYDVDYTDFTESEQTFIDGVTKENGFENIEIGYGAGRNG